MYWQVKEMPEIQDIFRSYGCEYLGRYTHRVAISNNRIIKAENGKVTFKWKDYRDGKEKMMCISAEEFIRRFLMQKKANFPLKYC